MSTALSSSVILLPGRATASEAWKTPITANDRLQRILALLIVLVGPRPHDSVDVVGMRDRDAIDAVVVALGPQPLQGERVAFLRTSSYSCYRYRAATKL